MNRCPMQYSTNGMSDRELLGTALWLLLVPVWKVAELFGRNIITDEKEK